MSIRLYKSYTPGTRNRALSAFTEITKTTPENTKTLPWICIPRIQIHDMA